MIADTTYTRPAPTDAGSSCSATISRAGILIGDQWFKSFEGNANLRLNVRDLIDRETVLV